MYILFRLNPDGDSYSLFNEKELASKAFQDIVQTFNEDVNNRKDMGWDDYKTLLCEITDPNDFGFGSRGDVYGMEIIDSLQWED